MTATLTNVGQFEGNGMLDVPQVRPGEQDYKQHYKWIAKRLESLDPEVDYAEIWRLTVTYYVDDLFMNIIYTTGIQNFTQPPAGTILLVNNGKGPTLKGPQERAFDTLVHFWKWFEYGPDDPGVQGSVERVNRIHNAMARVLPGAFPARDFIYTAGWTCCDVHRLFLSLGLPGFSDIQKAGAHRYWQKMMSHFKDEDGRPVDFPESFDATVAFLEEYERHPWPKVPTGKILAKALTDQFAAAWFPPGFRWLGQQLILSLQKPATRALMDMGDPNPILRPILRGGVAALVFAKINLLPDPKLSTPEKARMKRVRPGQHHDAPTTAVSACPYHTRVPLEEATKLPGPGEYVGLPR